LESRTKPGIAFTTLLLLLTLLPTPPAAAFTSSQLPAIRIGEQDTSNYRVLNPWGGLAFDPAGNLWVADSENNRVLGFAAPFNDNMNASFVIGQPNFQSVGASAGTAGLRFPMYLTFDAAGNLWVSDTQNNRVLEFRAPLTNGESAFVVIGQENFTTTHYKTSRNALSSPEQVTFDPIGDLWVADGGNGRILEYQPPFTTGMNASLVLGEPDFTHRYCQPIGTSYDQSCSSHSSLTSPTAITFDSTSDIWVSDSYQVNGRLVEFKPPFKDGMHPSLVLQPVYASAIAFDSSGNMWLTCQVCYGGEGGDVVEYRPPFSPHSILWDNGYALNASIYLVSATATTPMSNLLALPAGLTFDSAGNLWVVDARSSWLIGLLGRVVGCDAQIHPVAAKEGTAYFENQKGLLVPLSSIPVNQVGSLSFPDGLFNFTIQGLNSTEPVTVTIRFPTALPPDVGWWFNAGGSWMQLPASQVSIDGANLTITLTRASPKGVISMLGGPALGTGPAQISNTTSSANTSTSTTLPSTNIGNFPVESIAGGIILGLAALTILRYRRRRK